MCKCGNMKMTNGRLGEHTVDTGLLTDNLLLFN